MNLVMRVSDQVVALDFGRVDRRRHARGGAAQPEVVRAYLGGAAMSGADPRSEGLTAFYGPIQALYGVDFVVEEGGVTALLGANGAGKTTTLRAISGLIRREGDDPFSRASRSARLSTEASRGSASRMCRTGAARSPI